MKPLIVAAVLLVGSLSSPPESHAHALTAESASVDQDVRAVATWWRIECEELDKRWDSSNRRWNYYWRSAGGFENPSRDFVIRHGDSWVQGSPTTRRYRGPFTVNR